MVGSLESRWLYTRGAQSVLLVREEHSNGCRLVVHGPGTDIAIHAFLNIAGCMKHQAEIEMNLQASGYQLTTTSSDRRRARRTGRGPDHRRAAS